MILCDQPTESKRDREDPPKSPTEWNRAVDGLWACVVDSAQEGLAAHQVEAKIWLQVLALGREVLSAFFDQVGDGDLGETLEGADGPKLRRLPKLHPRPYQSIFGPFELLRAVYGTREGQKIESVPLDQRLQLPESKFSYLLQDWSQHLAVETPYGEVNRTLERILGFQLSIDSLERMNRKMSTPVVDYLDTLPSPPREEEGELLISSADGKGVPIRGALKSAPLPGSAPSKGPLPDRKKMALLGASYTVDRFPRTPEQIVAALFRDLSPAIDGPTTARPKPRHKRLRASLARCDSGTARPATDEIFGWLTIQAEERDPEGVKPHIVLMDGQLSLWDAAQSSFGKTSVEILDFLHVLPRLWDAAHLFHLKGGSEAKRFVRQRALRMLRGESRSVVTGLRRMATISGLCGRKRTKLERICRYLENNASRMRYDTYLAAGYPIATGVIEGACRHLVKDRLERTGMQWVLDGAQAMLDLRSMHLSDHWEAFQTFRVANENERLYPRTDLFGHAEWPLAA